MQAITDTVVGVGALWSCSRGLGERVGCRLGTLAVCVGGSQGDDGCGEYEDAAGEQCSLEAGGECLRRRCVRGEQVVGVAGGEGGEDRQS